MTTDAVGGVWNYALELARGLGAHGVQVVLATMGPRPSVDQRAEACALGNVTLCESDYRLEWMNDPWNDVAAAGEWLLDLEGEFSPDVIHLNGYVHGALPWRAPVMMVAHSCVLSWWEAVRGGTVPAEWERYREAVGTGLNAVEWVVAPSHNMLAALERHYGPLPCTQVIANGRNPANYAPRAKQPFVLGAGRWWDEAKNAAALAHAAAALSWPVRLAGEVNPPDDDSGAPWRNVELLGRCPPHVLARQMAHAAIFAAPARYEPFGLSILEAAMSGCALVLGDIPSLRENWNGAAVFVHPDDPTGLREALRSLIADNRARAALAHAARERAVRFTSERMTVAYLAAYARGRVVEPTVLFA